MRLVADEAPLRLALVARHQRLHGPGVAQGGSAQATRIAAGLAAVALSGEDRVRPPWGARPGTSPRSVPAGARGRWRASSPSFRKASVRPRAGPTSRPRPAAVSAAAGGRALCVILSDMLDPAGALAGAKAARARGHDVALIEVLDPIEIDPPDLGDVDSEDEETGEEIVALPPREARGVPRGPRRPPGEEAVDEDAAALGRPRAARGAPADAFDDVVTAALRAGVLRHGGRG